MVKDLSLLSLCLISCRCHPSPGSCVPDDGDNCHTKNHALRYSLCQATTQHLPCLCFWLAHPGAAAVWTWSMQLWRRAPQRCRQGRSQTAHGRVPQSLSVHLVGPAHSNGCETVTKSNSTRGKQEPCRAGKQGPDGLGHSRKLRISSKTSKGALQGVQREQEQ